MFFIGEVCVHEFVDSCPEGNANGRFAGVKRADLIRH